MVCHSCPYLIDGVLVKTDLCNECVLNNRRNKKRLLNVKRAISITPKPDLLCALLKSFVITKVIIMTFFQSGLKHNDRTL